MFLSAHTFLVTFIFEAKIFYDISQFMSHKSTYVAPSKTPDLSDLTQRHLPIWCLLPSPTADNKTPYIPQWLEGARVGPPTLKIVLCLFSKISSNSPVRGWSILT